MPNQLIQVPGQNTPPAYRSGTYIPQISNGPSSTLSNSAVWLQIPGTPLMYINGSTVFSSSDGTTSRLLFALPTGFVMDDTYMNLNTNKSCAGSVEGFIAGGNYAGSVGYDTNTTLHFTTNQNTSNLLLGSACTSGTLIKWSALVAIQGWP